MGHLNALEPDSSIPDTVYGLRKYDKHITAMHDKFPRHLAYVNVSGKIKPYKHGCMQDQDLDFCFLTFCTMYTCEMGVKCAWRHHPLTKAE
jgi:hypothetical protein